MTSTPTDSRTHESPAPVGPLRPIGAILPEVFEGFAEAIIKTVTTQKDHKDYERTCEN